MIIINSILLQTRMLETQSINSMSPRQLQEKIKDILKKFPEAVEAVLCFTTTHLYIQLTDSLIIL